MKKILPIALMLLCLLSSRAGDSGVKIIQGTPLAELGDAYDVLRRFSSVAVVEGTFYLAGKGPATIFVDGRRLERHIDLAMVPASAVDKIEIIPEARPEYGNNNGVILISLKKLEEDEFHLADVLEIVSTPLLGGSNDIELTGKKGRLSYNAGILVQYAGTKDNESRTSDSYTDKPGQTGIWLQERKLEDFVDINRDLSLAARASLGWQITPDHRIGVRYEYDYIKSNGDWGDLNTTVFRRKGEVIDLVNPTDRYPATSTSKSDKHVHQVNLSYQGNVDGWALSANIDLFAGHKPGKNVDCIFPGGQKECTQDKETGYAVGEGFSRLNASHRLWKGDIRFGLSLDNYYQNTKEDDLCDKNSLIHSDIFGIMPGAFVSLKQDYGFLDFDFALHFLYYYMQYSPCADDKTRSTIIEKLGQPDVISHQCLLHPMFSLSAPVGEGRMSAGVHFTTGFPDFSSLSIDIDKLEPGDASRALTYPSLKQEFFLKGEWRWIQLKGWGTYNSWPILGDVDENEFNGPDYWSMDWRLSLSPSVGIWETDLTATVHKQWLNLNTIPSADNLQAPLLTINWINGFNLPWGTRVDLGTFFRPKGAEGNLYYRNVYFKSDLSLHQSFFKDRLVVIFGIENLIRTPLDVAFYVDKSDREFVWNERLDHRTFKLTFKINL